MGALVRPIGFDRHDLRMALIVTRREVRDAFRDWRIIIPIIILTLVFPGLATLTARAALNFTQRFGAELVTERLVPFLLLVVGFFPMSFSLVIALETFVGEKERKSLEPLLATPLTNTQLYVGKMLAAIVPPMATSYLGIAVYIVGLVLAIGWSAPFELLIQILLLSTIQGVIMVAAAVIVSSQTTSVRAANLLASFIIVPVALLLQFEAVAMFWGNRQGLWWLIAALLVTMFMFVRMGIKIFNREELLGQDIDQLRLGWMWRVFWNRFSGRDSGRPGERVTQSYPSVFAWYRQTLRIIPRLKLPAATLLIALVGSILFGAIYAQRFPLPAEMGARLSGADIVANVRAFEQLFGRLPLIIFFQNARVLLLAAVLGIFTFGLAELFIFSLPWLILAFVGGLMAGLGENPLLFFVGAVLPHALVELPALLLAQSALLRWHASILARPPERTVGENWLLRAADFGRICFGLVLPLLAVAALIEALITPQVLLAVYGG
ncbi:MAG: stage II sporulation protein M [Candidatus Promineifilaceae bacterium]|nr:stage II sporulation protein M [Candidatus Promineifilaceae bacterium]